jgi:MraZ protein
LCWWGRKEIKGKWWKKVENWLGQSQIKVDDKGRISLPASSQESFAQGDVVLSVAVFDKKPYLELMSTHEWERKIESLKSFSDRNPKLKAYKRFLLSGSSKVNIDKQNRIIIPSFQRELIKLSKSAVLVNLNEKIELWSAELWAEASNHFINEFENLEDWANGFDEENTGGENELKSVA